MYAAHAHCASYRSCVADDLTRRSRVQRVCVPTRKASASGIRLGRKALASRVELKFSTEHHKQPHDITTTEARRSGRSRVDLSCGTEINDASFACSHLRDVPTRWIRIDQADSTDTQIIFAVLIWHSTEVKRDVTSAGNIWSLSRSLCTSR